MKIEKINVVNDGYVHCHSCFCSSKDSLSADSTYSFDLGINKLYGDIDSGVWAISYLLSMYSVRPKDFVLFEKTEIMINGQVIPLQKMPQYSCYMDKSYPLYSTNASIKKMITKGIHANKLDCSADDVRKLFGIDSERFERSLSSVGNESFKAMAAIGYSYGKQVFCFPWLSKKRFAYYHTNMTDLLDILEGLNKIVILPLGK